MRSIAAVTTFHAEGYALYGRRMVESFDRHWPAGVPLYVYAEGCAPRAPSDRVVVLDLESECPGLVAFKRRHVDDPAAHGAEERVRYRTSLLRRPWKLRTRRLSFGAGFHWDAVRFSHKCFAIFAAARRTDADLLFWIDADVRFFDDLPPSFLEGLLPEGYLVSCLRRWRRPELALEIVPSLGRLRVVDRTQKHSECGFVGYDLRAPAMREFLEEFEALYRDDLLFREWEYHDSYLFDRIRHRFERRGFPSWDIGEGIGRETSHPFVNCRLGRYMDHMKGERKRVGSSDPGDLVVERAEAYWAAVGVANGGENSLAAGGRRDNER